MHFDHWDVQTRPTHHIWMTCLWNLLVSHHSPSFPVPPNTTPLIYQGDWVLSLAACHILDLVDCILMVPFNMFCCTQCLFFIFCLPFHLFYFAGGKGVGGRLHNRWYMRMIGHNQKASEISFTKEKNIYAHVYRNIVGKEMCVRNSPQHSLSYFLVHSCSKLQRWGSTQKLPGTHREDWPTGLHGEGWRGSPTPRQQC